MNPHLGSKVHQRAHAKAISDAQRYLFSRDGENIVYVGTTNQLKPLIDLVVITNFRLMGVLLSHPHESPKIQAWWPQVRSFSFGERWNTLNRLTVVTQDGRQLHFGTIPEQDVPHVHAHAERFMSAEAPGATHLLPTPPPVSPVPAPLPVMAPKPAVTTQPEPVAETPDPPVAATPMEDRRFLAEIDAAQRVSRKWPFALLVTEGAAIAMRGNGWPVAVAGLLLALAIASVERSRRRPRVEYADSEPHVVVFARLEAAFQQACSTDMLWQIPGEAKIGETERRANGGAGFSVRRENASASFGGVPGIVIDLDVPRLESPAWTLYFCPDRILSRSRGGVWAERRYRELRVAHGTVRMIEDMTPPQDARIVGRTWEHVTVRGGPDRRFKSNRELPIVEYGELVITAGGARTAWMTSRPETVETLALALAAAGAR
ncbi:hypothetical protein HII36_11100 [Nonomuraea sp. NN258]|uniref:hypothetical protein n=1 Tax=Nonomuraea antri TaxID=2730852 RepID=UPI00156A22A2|nr:hypothetical protein [Nonomuraea antri]NRQ32382.1 hypothetical protein [Nonomuraea antri]